MKDSWPRAAEVLAAGGTTTEAAQAADVTTRTIRKWKADQLKFADAIDDNRGRMLAESAGILAHASRAASHTLAELTEEGADQHRLAAARTILDMASRYRSDHALEERIRTLEITAGLRGAWNE